jgi:hypothetical protein
MKRDVKTFLRLSSNSPMDSPVEEEDEEETQAAPHGRFTVSDRNVAVEASGKEEEENKQYRLKAVQVSSLITGDQYCLFFWIKMIFFNI